MIKYGLVSEFSAAKGKAKVKFLEDDIVTNWLPIIYNRTLTDKSFDFLTVNEQVVCWMDQNSETGVIIGSIYSEASEPSNEAGSKVWGRKFEDGTVLKYDQANHKLTVKLSGSGAKVEIEGDVKVTGKIEATGNIESSGDVKTLTVSLNTHTHSGVTVGAGVTGTPVPTP